MFRGQEQVYKTNSLRIQVVDNNPRQDLKLEADSNLLWVPNLEVANNPNRGHRISFSKISKR